MKHPKLGERWRRIRDGRECVVVTAPTTIDGTRMPTLRYMFTTSAPTRGRGIIRHRTARVWMRVARFVEAFEPAR